MPTTFSVSLVVDQLPLTDENLDRLFQVLPDAVPASVAGLVTVSAPIEAVDAEVAAFTLAETITEAFPGAIAVRVDQDPVSISDIAERTVGAASPSACWSRGSAGRVASLARSERLVTRSVSGRGPR